MAKFNKKVSNNTNRKLDYSHFDIVKCPHMTEKTHSMSENGQVVFKVAVKSNKDQIKSSISTLFNLKIKSINIINMKGKEKVFRGRRGKRSDWKKAIVTLKDKSQVQKLMMGNKA